MATRQVPREQWNEYLDTLSKGHRGWTVTVEVTGDEIGAQRQIDGLPLIGISSDPEAGGGPRIEVIVGEKEKPQVKHTTHSIIGPQGLWVQESDEGVVEALEIDADSDVKTIVLIGSPETGTEGLS